MGCAQTFNGVRAARDPENAAALRAGMSGH
jgi:hypothetical protein